MLNGKSNCNAQVLVDLSCLSVLPQQPPQNPLPSHPEHLGRHPSIARTLSLTRAGMSSLSLCGKQVPRPCAGVHCGGLDDNTTIFNQFLDMGTGVGVADFSLLGGIKPDFAFANTCDAGSEAFL
jgi:hypothetical protein